MTMCRRRFLIRAAPLLALPVVGSNAAWASGPPIDLQWSDLVPVGSGTEIERLRSLGVVQHGQLNTPWDQETSGFVTEEFNGKTVKIPGFLVPLKFEGNGMTAGLLVPYVGACIHVPPPPPNQLIFVTSDTPYKGGGIFEAVFVTGVFGTAASVTELAEVGYQLEAEAIAPYR